MRAYGTLSWALILLSGPVCLQAQEPRAIIERAIEAHGGMKRLARARADLVKLKGKLFVAGKEVPFEGETSVQLPDKLKTTLQVSSERGTYRLTQILNGAKVWVGIDGQPQKVSPSAAAEMKETLQLDRAIRLVPLLKDPTFELAYTGESEVNQKSAVGVVIRAKGRKELRLYFDKQTHLLVKTEHKLDDGSGKEIRQEAYYSNFQDIGGYKRPLQLVAFRNGVKVMEAELVDVKYFERINDDEFTIP